MVVGGVYVQEYSTSHLALLNAQHCIVYNPTDWGQLMCAPPSVVSDHVSDHVLER